LRIGLTRSGPTECQGYLRARATSVVREETGRLIEQEGEKVAYLRSRIEEASLSLVIKTITQNYRQGRLQPGSRRAA
jgi:hypothetical protein